ncbi:unnamed protein product [Alternaria alternata]
MPEGSLSVHTHQALQQTSSHSHNRREIPEGARNYLSLPAPLTYEEALLVHHYRVRAPDEPPGTS